jgi:hypothetical protein
VCVCRITISVGASVYGSFLAVYPYIKVPQELCVEG